MVKSPHKPTPLYPCEICKYNVEETDEAVECDCNRWYHIKCAKVTKAQYKDMVNGTFAFTWVCKNCLNLRTKKSENRSCPKDKPTQTDVGTEKDTLENEIGLNDDRISQLNKIIEVLMSDIGDLKEQLSDQKQENLRLADTIAKKMEVIDKLEQLTYNLVKDTGKEPTYGDTSGETKNYDTSETGLLQKIPKQGNTRHQQTRHKDQTDEPESLLIGDSTLRTASSMIEAKLNHDIRIESRVKPGAKIRDVSKYLSEETCLPHKVVINIGSNNVAYSKTPNHTMRPLWYTIEAGKKKHPKTKWYVCGILPRADIRDKYITDTNEAYKFMCRQLGATYIDTSQITEDRHFLRDGIHPSKDGAAELANIIIDRTCIMTHQANDPNKTTQKNSQSSITP